MKNKKLKLIGGFIISALFLFFWLKVSETRAGGASLYLSPASGTYSVGQTFSVKVRVNSGDQPINAAEGTLIFNPQEVSVVNLSKTGSIFSLWTTEPTFSNSLGTIVFGGGTPTPFSGKSGTIFTIVFKSRLPVSTQVNFSSGSILSADGKGTNILTNMIGGLYTFKTGAAPQTTEETPFQTHVGTPSAPILSSSTHPQEDQWYSNNSPEIHWKLPPDVEKVSYGLDQNPTTNPKFVAEGLPDKVSFENLKDGIWYFHINFKNSYGWGKLTHRKIMIDTLPPASFEIEIQKEDPTDPTPILLFNTTDKPSGIAYYEVKIGEGEPFQVTGITKSNPLELPPQAPGTHKIVVKAFDRAGNFSEAKTDLEVLPIESPKIESCPKNVLPDSKLTLEGKSIPYSHVTLFYQKENEEPIKKEAETNEKGYWRIVLGSLEQGEYKTWAQTQNEKGALSLPSKECRFSVGLPPFLKFGKIAINYLSVMVTLVLIIIGLLLIFFYAWYRISIWKKRLKRETRELNRAVVMAFKNLRKEIKKQIEYLDGKPGLTKEEKKIRDNLKKALEYSRKTIEKELQDIKKELK